MKKTDRNLLPYRKNCEAYLRYRNKYVVARDTGRGYLEFPGGGIRKGETPARAIHREIKEEIGVVAQRLNEIGVIRFDWHSDWATTQKQKRRYTQYRGEEMHLFEGVVSTFSKDYPAEWRGNKTMPLLKAIECIKSNQPFPPERWEYYQTQLHWLRKMNQKH